MAILGDGIIVDKSARASRAYEQLRADIDDLKSDGSDVLVFTIGVGVEINQQLLELLATKSIYFLKVPSFNELHEKVEGVTKFLAGDSLKEGCKLETGEDGRDGEPGLPGTDGRDGRKGDRGESKDGADGFAGMKGSKGEYNPVGRPGPQGSPGPKGKMGQKGELIDDFFV